MKTRVAAVLLIMFGLSAGSLFAQKYEVDPYAGGFFPTSSESVGRFRNEGMYGVRGGVFLGDHFQVGGNFNYISHFDLKTNNPTMTELDNAGIFRPPVRAYEYGALMHYNFAGPSWFGSRVTPYLTGGVGALRAVIKPLSNEALASNNATIAQMNALNGTTTTTNGFNNSSVFVSSGAYTVTTTTPTSNPFGATTSTASPSTNPFGASSTVSGIATTSTTTISTGNPFSSSNAAVTNISNITNNGFILTDGDTFLTLTYGFGIKGLNLWGPMGLHLEVAGHTMPNFFGHQMTWPQATAGLTFTWGER